MLCLLISAIGASRMRHSKKSLKNDDFIGYFRYVLDKEAYGQWFNTMQKIDQNFSHSRVVKRMGYHNSSLSHKLGGDTEYFHTSDQFMATFKMAWGFFPFKIIRSDEPVSEDDIPHYYDIRRFPRH